MTTTKTTDSQYLEHADATILATIPGNNVNVIRVYGRCGDAQRDDAMIVTQTYGNPANTNHQRIEMVVAFTHDDDGYRKAFRQAMTFATELALVGVNDDDDQ